MCWIWEVCERDVLKGDGLGCGMVFEFSEPCFDTPQSTLWLLRQETGYRELS